MDDMIDEYLPKTSRKHKPREKGGSQMARLNVKPTRMELNTLKERLKTATRVINFSRTSETSSCTLHRSGPVKMTASRQKVETALIGNMQEFVLAKCLENDLMVQEIFAVPTREVSLHIETENIS